MNNIGSDIKKITDSILYLEKKLNLLEWKINDVFVWQSARITIYLSILNKIIPNNAVIEKPVKGIILKAIFKRIFNSVFLYNPFLDYEKSEILIFDSGRKYFVEGNYIDIYTKYFCEDLENQNLPYKKYGTNYLNSNLNRQGKNTKNLDFIYLVSKLLVKILPIKLNKANIAQVEKVDNELKFLLGVDINLLTIFKNEIKRFKSQYPFYKLLFQLKKANTIYLINSSNKSPLIKAAKDCNIRVNELQHGLIPKEGLVANYPYTIEGSLEYFPHNFFLWKDLNMCSVKLPLSEKNIISHTNRHLQYMLEKNRRRTRNKNQILIVSQPYCSEEILKYVMNNVEEMKNWKFVYKIHPAEDINCFMNSSLHRFSELNNLIFVNNEESIYKLFSESKYVIGIFSTAVFEAPFFGCIPLLLNLPGVELANSLIKQGNAKLIDVNEKLIQYI